MKTKRQQLNLYNLLHCIPLQICFLIALCLLSYGSTLNGTFVFDDTVAVKQNKAINQLPTNYTAIFLSDFWGTSIASNDSHKSYRPLTSLMFHWEWMYWKLEPYHMKLINLVLHTLNTILVVIVMRNITFSGSPNNIALMTGIIFAVHPVHTEAVSGIVSRADLMFCFVYLLCLIICCYSHGKDKLWTPILVVGLTCVGILFKESAIIIPIACVFFNYSLERKYILPWKYQLKTVLSKTNLFYGLATISILIARLWVADFKSPKFRKVDNPIAHADSLLSRVLSQNYLYVHNFTILLNPWQLCFDWAFGCIRLIESFKDMRIVTIVIMYFLISSTVCRYRSNYAASFGLVMIIIPFLPASGIIRVGFVIAERVLYVPSIGFCYLVSYGFKCLYENVRLRYILNASFSVLVITFILRCRQRSAEWLTEDKLFSSALAICPNNAKVS